MKEKKEFSPSMLSKDAWIVTAIPLCNVCQNWDGPGKCKVLGNSPEIYRNSEKRDCSHAVLDTKRFNFPRFSELYPEDTEKLLKRRK